MMFTKTQITEWLMTCTVSAPSGCPSGTGLKEIHQKVFNHSKNVTKADAVKDLTEFYFNKQNIIDIWNGYNTGLVEVAGLNAVEKEFITAYVQYNGKEFAPTTKAIAEKYGISPLKTYNPRYDFYNDSDYHYNYLKFLHLIRERFSVSKAVQLFPGGKSMPPFVLEALKELIPPLTIEYEDYAPSDEDYVICRKDRLGDFAAVVRFAGSEQLKVKQYTLDITKAKLAKMVEAIGFEEVCDKDGNFCTPKDAKRINDFKVATPLFVLSANSGLIEITDNLTVKPSKNATILLSKPPHELAKQLFYDYMKKNMIYETHYLTYIQVYDNEGWLNWDKCRRPIIDLLKTCPVGRFVKFSDFEKYALIFCEDFFRQITNCSVFLRGFDFGYGSGYGNQYYPDWDECDVQIIRLILSFLSAIGMIDIAYTERTPRIKYSGDDYCIGISGFRITSLGAWILGLTKEYNAPKAVSVQAAEGGMIIQHDHTVLISGLKSRIEHETYLSRFLTKISDDVNIAVYKIDFQSMVRASAIKLNPKQIKSYLEKASDKPLPENVARSLNDWQTKVGRVVIRTVTILETDDSLLLQELTHIKGMDKYVSDKISNAVVIDGDEQKKVKTLVEKNGWLL